MTGGPLLVEFEQGTATLTLNRPDKLNAISFELMVLLRDELDRLASRDDVCCVVLAGAGRSFSAGFDLESLPEKPEELRFLAETIDALEMFPRPTVARIQGHCLTGALELALGCDVLVASEDATFADTHARWGIVPVCGMSVRLPERIGPAKAKLLAYTGRRIDARTAAVWGLVDLVVSDDGLDAAIAEVVVDIGANSADANRIQKSLIGRGTLVDLPRSERLREEREVVFGVPEDRLERLAVARPRSG